MKGYVKIDKCDMLAAIIGFEMWYDAAKDTRNKGIQLYYEKHYVNGGWFTKWWDRNKKPHEFVRSRLPSFGSWDDVLHTVLTREEADDVAEWCYTHKSVIEPLKALYRSMNCVHNDALVDDSMAKFINKYKTYLENIK